MQEVQVVLLVQVMQFEMKSMQREQVKPAISSTKYWLRQEVQLVRELQVRHWLITLSQVTH